MRCLLGLLLLAFAAVPASAADPTQAFLAHAAAVNKFQVAASQLALRKTQSNVVHGFAHQIILDYSVAGMKLRQLTADAKLPLHDTLDPPHKALFDGLSKTPPGKALSKAYFEAEDKTLRDDAAVFEAYAATGDDERLKIYAQEMAPILRSQLDQLAKLRK
jgi:predicted outer membrane protein